MFYIIFPFFFLMGFLYCSDAETSESQEKQGPVLNKRKAEVSLPEARS